MGMRHTKQSHQVRRQLGRHVKQPPKPSPQARRRAQLTRRQDQVDEQMHQNAEQKAHESAEADRRHSGQCRDIAMLRAGQAGLNPLATRRLANVIETRRQAHVHTGQPANTFNVYVAIDSKLAQLGYGVAVGNANTLDAQRLPPPKGEGNPPPPGVRQATPDVLEARRSAMVRAQERAAEKRRADAEDKAERLRRLGVQDPSLPWPGGGSRLGN